MKVTDVTEGVSNAWKRTTKKTTRQYRCKSGPRKGRVMASPASCNKPLKTKSSARLKGTKRKMGSQRSYKSNLTRRRNPYSRRLNTLNK
jgi:hypothetical protein